MLYILSAGDAYPEQVINTHDLFPTADCVVEKRYCSLPLSYIKETHNASIKEAPKASLVNTTSLGVSAMEKALQEAAIAKEALGLVIGDTCTPCEFCPSEAQRIAGKLGLKIPAYDIIASSCSLSAQLKALLSWRPERVPSVTALVSSQTTSQVVDYSQKESLLFGDGASAVLVSTERKSNLVVKSAFYALDTTQHSFLTSTPYDHLSFGEIPSEEFVTKKVQKILDTLHPTGKSISLIVSPLFEDSTFKEVKKSLKNSEVSLMSSFATTGDTFNAYAGSLLAREMKNVVDQVLIVQFGSGFSFGGVLLEKQKNV